MGTIVISYPVKERDIEPLCKRFHNFFSCKLDFVRVSKALQRAKYSRYPRTKRAKYGSLQRGFSLQEFKEFLNLMTPEEHRFRFYCLWSVWWGERQELDVLSEDDTIKIKVKKKKKN